MLLLGQNASCLKRYKIDIVMIMKQTDNSTITWQEFENVELKVGTIVEVLPFPEARKPAYKLKIDFGEIGTRWSSAQITKLYEMQSLLNRQVICVTNFPKKQIGPFWSECLTCGFVSDDGEVVLAVPERKVMNGMLLR